jgi:uncharacterized glyoxalase superfamily protein PhnB
VVEIERLAPVLAVADVAAAVEHYRRLGFDVTPYGDGVEYAFARRGPVEIHLAHADGLDPATSTSALYLWVSDADELAREWRDAGAGRVTPPKDTEYGLREGAHIDPDGNLLRFGSPLADR